MIREYLALVRADMDLSILGVHRVAAGLSDVTARAVTEEEEAYMRRVADRIKRAALAYRPGARCLPQAVATARLLRGQGHPVSLVVAVRRFPFAAHAWVECGGQVLTDRQSVREEFQPILKNLPHVKTAEEST